MREYDNIQWALERARQLVRQGDVYLAGIMTECAQVNLERLRAKATKRFAFTTINLEDSHNG